MNELLSFTVPKVPYTEIECKLSLEYSWNKNDKENIKKDKRAIKQFLQHCELEGIKSFKNMGTGTFDAWLGAYIHPKISQLDEIVRILNYYELEANKLTVPLWLPPSLSIRILNKYSFWTIHSAITGEINFKIGKKINVNIVGKPDIRNTLITVKKSTPTENNKISLTPNELWHLFFSVFPDSKDNPFLFH